MDELLRILLTWQFLIFCLGLSAITFVIRKIFEFVILNNPKMPGTKNSLLWRSLLLPIAPVINGAIAGYLAKNYPYPENLANSTYGRISFGLIAGLLSGLVYRVFVELLRSKINQATLIISPQTQPELQPELELQPEILQPETQTDPAVTSEVVSDQSNNQ